MKHMDKAFSKKRKKRSGTVTHTCNPSISRGQDRRIAWAQEFETSLGNMVKPCLYQNFFKSHTWWHTPIVPATGEAEAGELPEPRRQRLQWAEIVPLHSSLGDKSETPSQKKRKTENDDCLHFFYGLYSYSFHFTMANCQSSAYSSSL